MLHIHIDPYFGEWVCQQMIDPVKDTGALAGLIAFAGLRFAFRKLGMRVMRASCGPKIPRRKRGCIF